MHFVLHITPLSILHYLLTTSVLCTRYRPLTSVLLILNVLFGYLLWPLNSALHTTDPCHMCYLFLTSELCIVLRAGTRRGTKGMWECPKTCTPHPFLLHTRRNTEQLIGVETLHSSRLYQHLPCSRGGTPSGQQWFCSLIHSWDWFSSYDMLFLWELFITLCYIHLMKGLLQYMVSWFPAPPLIVQSLVPHAWKWRQPIDQPAVVACV